MIEHLVQGMTAEQVFGILNRLIDEHNQLMSAIGGGLVDGRFDYNGLANKPTINSVELVGDLTQADLEISIDQTVVTELNSFGNRIGEAEHTLNEKVSANDLAATLRDYALTRDIPDVSGFATTAAMNSALAQKVDNSTRTADLASLINAINGKVDSGDVYTSSQTTALLAEKEGVIRDLDTIRRGAAAGATAYQLPQSGIPASDMAAAVRTSLDKADTAYQLPRDGMTVDDMHEDIKGLLDKANTAYQKPQGGIPASDMAAAVRTSLGKADSAYQLPANGIPKTDLESTIVASLESANTAYQKPQGGIPARDLASAVQTSLGKADTAYQKPGTGIPASDMASTVQLSLSKADSAIQSHQSLANYPSTNDWNVLLSQMQTAQTAASTSATAAGNSATAAANSASTCTQQCSLATQKAQEAASSAQSVSGALGRIDALEATVNGTQQTTGLTDRTLRLENKMGNAGDKVSVSDDLKETRVKSNDILAALKEVPEVYDKVREIVALDVNY